MWASHLRLTFFTVSNRERVILCAICVRLFTIRRSNKASNITSLAVPINLSPSVGFVRLASILPRSDSFSLEVIYETCLLAANTSGIGVLAKLKTKIGFSCPQHQWFDLVECCYAAADAKVATVTTEVTEKRRSLLEKSSRSTECLASRRSQERSTSAAQAVSIIIKTVGSPGNVVSGSLLITVLDI